MKTIGEERVRVDFNQSGNELVADIKKRSAELINLLDAVRNDGVSKAYGRETSGEKLRLISLAMTDFESAAMWAVKAVTS